MERSNGDYSPWGRKSYLFRLVLIKEKYWLGYLENSFLRYRESLDGLKHPLPVTIQCDDCSNMESSIIEIFSF